MMHTVFLSEPVLYKQLVNQEMDHFESGQASVVDEELKLLAHFG